MALCFSETNLPLRGQFKHAWLPSWSPGKKLDADSMQRNGMDGSIVRPLPACVGTHPYMLSTVVSVPADHITPTTAAVAFGPKAGFMNAISLR